MSKANQSNKLQGRSWKSQSRTRSSKYYEAEQNGLQEEPSTAQKTEFEDLDGDKSEVDSDSTFTLDSEGNSDEDLDGAASVSPSGQRNDSISV